jgi:acyl CoA:acetate/3-ketoacid CoA transferase beta subunit
LPLTGIQVVDLVVTDLGVFDVTDNGLVLVDIGPGVTVQELRDKTEAHFTVHEDLKQAA